MVQITVSPEASPLTDDQPRSADALLNAVLALRPGLLFDVRTRYVSGGVADGGASFALANLADNSRLIPAGNNKPVLVNSNKDLMFGLDKPLVHEAERQHDMTGKYTVAWVGRITPTSTGGPVIGNRLGTADSSWVGYDGSSRALAVYHAGGLASSAGSPQNDSAVYINMISVNPALEIGYFIDNVYLGVHGPATFPSWGVNGQLMVGGYGDQAADSFLDGRLRAAVVFPGLALHESANAAALASVQAWLAAVKAR